MTDTIKQKQIIMTNFNSILKRFRVLKELKVNYKLWVEDMPIKINDDIIITKIFTIDNSYVPFITRWIYSQNRVVPINILIDDTNYIHQNFNVLNDSAKQTIITTIIDAIPGIINLRTTYSYVQEHATKLTNIIDILQKINEDYNNKM